MVRALRVHAPGSPFVLDEVDLPPPAAGEARVKHHAIGVNFRDVYHRRGDYPTSMPAILGGEAAGVVVEVGAGVTHMAPGDRVAYVTKAPGAYADERNVPAKLLLHLPQEITFEIAAASLLKGLTAEYLIRRTFRADARHTIVVFAAAGGVGTFLCQWDVSLGVRVIGVVSSDDKARVALQAGAHHVLVGDHGKAAELPKRVRELAPEGVRRRV